MLFASIHLNSEPIFTKKTTKATAATFMPSTLERTDKYLKDHSINVYGKDWQLLIKA